MSEGSVRALRAAVAVVLLASLLAGAAGPARSKKRSADWSARAGSALVGISALEVPGVLKVVDARVLPSVSEVSTAGFEGRARSRARATQLDAKVLSGTPALAGLVNSADQSSPPDRPDGQVNRLAGLNVAPLVSAGVATTSARTRWRGSSECGAGPVAQSSSEIVDLRLLNGLDGLGRSVVRLGGPSGGLVNTRTSVVIGGERKGRTLRAESSAGLATVTLLDGTPSQISLEILEPARLVARAQGKAGTGAVEWSAPVVAIRQGANRIGTLDAATLNRRVEVPGGILDIGLGAVRSEVAPDGRKVTARAALLSITAIGAPLPVRLVQPLEIVPLEASVEVPKGGIRCGGARDDEAEEDEDEDDGERRSGGPESRVDASAAQVAPGGRFDYTVDVPNRGDEPIGDLKVRSRTKGPEGTRIVATDPPATSVEGGEARWENLGELPPGQVKRLKVTVEAPAQASSGARLHNETEVEGRSPRDREARPLARAVLDAPAVAPPLRGGCRLRDSNLGTSHREVEPGQRFVQTVHVFNAGDAPCAGVEVGHELEVAEVEACDSGCSREGKQSRWKVDRLEPGSSRSLTVVGRAPGRPDSDDREEDGEADGDNEDEGRRGRRARGTARIRSGDAERAVEVHDPRLGSASVLVDARSQLASAPSPSTFRASGEAALVAAEAVEIPGTVVVADVALAPARAGVDSAGVPGVPGSPRAHADARSLEAEVLSGDLAVDGVGAETAKSAPGNGPPADSTASARLEAAPLAAATVASADSEARWPLRTAVDSPEPVARAASDLAAAELLPGASGNGSSVVAFENERGGEARAEVAVATVGAAGQAQGLETVASAQLASVTVLQNTPNEVQIDVVSPPELKASATGTPGGASVEYSAPVLRVTRGGTLVGELDTAGAQLAVPVPAGGVLIEVGRLESAVAADGTAAEGQADLLSVEVDGLPGTVEIAGPIAIAPLRAEAEVPAGGIACCDPAGGLAAEPLAEVHVDWSAAEVAPGATFDYLIAVPNRGADELTDVLVTAEVKGPAGTTVIDADPPTSTTTEGAAGVTATWDDIGPLAPNETGYVTLTVGVPEAAIPPEAFSIDVGVSALSGDTGVDKSLTAGGPAVSGIGGGCRLDGSNLAASHREVYPGETFALYAHLLNSGAKPCEGIDVTVTLDDDLIVQECEGCRGIGGSLGLVVPELEPGASITLPIIVAPAESAPLGSTLPGRLAADPDAGRTVSAETEGPTVTGASVLGATAAASAAVLPVTGGDPAGLVAGAALAGWVMARRRARTVRQRGAEAVSGC